MKYNFLINVLDKLRYEATSSYIKRYLPNENDLEKINQARSRAYIHLYLKVLFGILDFDEREKLITDDPYDGGIDGYYIDEDRKFIYLIQSKFRITEHLFENKEIRLDEILTMDIDRILGGELTDENNNPYNGKIKKLQREIAETPDIARYNYRVTILANLPSVSPTKLRQLTGGYNAEVFDHQRSYRELLLPVISGTYFTADDISIPIDLSNKNAGSKISYTVNTKYSDCEITVLFVPTLEIAKIMSKYKNSILKYNPRSFLEFEGKNVNNSIKETILKNGTNEFALYNNGITMISDETNINEKIGTKNKAQLRIKNPQIINGGQTSYSLSRIYEENPGLDSENIFQNKEVLLKIITFMDNISDEKKLELIDEISEATNKQTPVINADRFANESFHKEIQQKIFETYGLLFERKRGEYADGIQSEYVAESDVIERNLFFRLYYTANGNLRKGIQRKLFQKNDFFGFDINDQQSLDKCVLGYRIYSLLALGKNTQSPVSHAFYYKIFLYICLFLEEGIHQDQAQFELNYKIVELAWAQFMNDRRKNSEVARKTRINKTTGEEIVIFMEKKYLESVHVTDDLRIFLNKFNLSAIKQGLELNT
ncbi:AIPR family protein [Methylophilus flavus]|uniref:AIPR family protein n=1 Tax=Methylophilus flavus TaxID=640084 RepID=A0ABW3PAD6_9PROT